MKKIITVLLLVSSVLMLKAQDSITISDLAIPDASAFMHLDVSNTIIASPKATKAVTLSLLSSLTQAYGIPQNYAAEFTPYWFIKSKNRTALKYLGYNIRSKKMNPFAGLKTSSFSVASVNSIQDTSGNTVNNLALAARGTIFRIYPKGYKEKLYQSYATIQILNRKRMSEYQKRAYVYIAREETAKADSVKNIIDQMINQELQDSMNVLSDVISTTKPLLSLDFALAYSSIFDFNNNISGVQFGRFGAWTNLTYTQRLGHETSTNYLHLHGYARYLINGSTPVPVETFLFDEAFDVGFKVEFEHNKFNVGFEYIYRTTESTNTSRSVGVIQYKLNKNIYLTGAFGKNFGETNNLIALLGVKWGLQTGSETMSFTGLKL